MGNYDRSQTESLEIRQAKASAVEAYKAELADEDKIEEAIGIENGIANTMNSLSLYETFGDKLAGINGALVEADVFVRPKYDYEYGFDDIEEVQQLQDQTQTLVNRTRGTRYAGVADAIHKTVAGQAPSLVAELVLLSENSESQTL